MPSSHDGMDDQDDYASCPCCGWGMQRSYFHEPPVCYPCKKAGLGEVEGVLNQDYDS